MNNYDLIVIGGGSGGVRAARIAANHGARVALCEKDRMGGTCVIRGCIPKKILFYSSQYSNYLSMSRAYGWKLKPEKINFHKLILNKNNELRRLEKLYTQNLVNAGVDIFYGNASFENKNEMTINNRTISAKNIIIATGGKPKSLEVTGGNYCINSDEIMRLKYLPKKLAIIGAGYIAVEFAFIFSLLGSKVTLICRNKILRGFDTELVKNVESSLNASGVKIIFKQEVSSVYVAKKLKIIKLKSNNKYIKADEVLCAIGRVPNINDLKLQNIGIQTDNTYAINVNRNLQTKIKNIYAIGDVTNRLNLTPVAIAEGQALADKLYGKMRSSKLKLDYVGSAVFSSPPICSVGPTEELAKKIYKHIEIYESKFNALKYSIVKKKIPSYIKIIVNGQNDKIISAHMHGEEAPEIIQMISVSINAKATMRDFKDTFAIHPTVAEEFVTFKKASRVYKN